MIIGNTNAITYQEIFRLFKEDRIRTGYTNFNIGMFFMIPDDWEHFHHIDENGKKIARNSNSCWFTNLEVEKHKEYVTLYKKYKPEEYPKYDNYNVINVNTYTDIPSDYKDTMGVPITFVNKHNPEQFEIIGMSKTPVGTHLRTKEYPKQTQVNKDGMKSNVTKLNDGAAIKVAVPPADKTYYIVDDEYYIAIYPRILIKNKKVKK